MKGRVPGQGSLDLFGEADRAARLEAWRATLMVDCCTGEPCPPDAQGRAQVRCGRCGEVTPPFGMLTNHDLGWIGCFTGPPVRQFRSAEEMSAGRHDNLHHAPCARPGCGHAWGIHRTAWAAIPHEEAHCYGWCGCPGYLAPEAA